MNEHADKLKSLNKCIELLHATGLSGLEPGIEVLEQEAARLIEDKFTSELDVIRHDFSEAVSKARHALQEDIAFWEHHRKVVREDGPRGYVETVCLIGDKCYWKRQCRCK